MPRDLDRIVGSSPRVRGTELSPDPGIQGRRIIPACAGNSAPASDPAINGADHPRVCGEQRYSHTRPAARSGSSPRVRGTGPCAGRSGATARIIPACAGNRVNILVICRVSSDHPRVCGEQRLMPRDLDRIVGSSPRVRGTELSPDPGIQGRRIIPACAGNRNACRNAESEAPDHPRVCGEQSPAMRCAAVPIGSSPRVRGTDDCAHAAAVQSRIIPACAGNRYPPTAPRKHTTDHPRVCGEQVDFDTSAPDHGGSSPRVRGTAIPTIARDISGRIIPACAGNSLSGIY